MGTPWGLKGVQCEICHATGKPTQQDIGTIVYQTKICVGGTEPASTACDATHPCASGGTCTAGVPRSAGGHDVTVYGSRVTGVCFTCHGTAASPESVNPASVIPVSGGDFAPTSKGLAPIANEFLNGPHARYNGSSNKLDIVTKTNYGSPFIGYICRSSNAIGSGSILTTMYRDGEAETIPNLDSTANLACTNAGDGSSISGAAGFYVREGEAAGTTANGVAFAATDQGNCMTCHDIHWSLNSTDPEAEPLRRECTTCHSHAPGDASAAGAPQIELAKIRHPAAPGTPLEDIATTPWEACMTCHMPDSSNTGSAMHLWRINTNPSYQTMGATQANTAPDGTYVNAAWVDLNHACGQCHGGGTAEGPGNEPVERCSLLDHHRTGGRGQRHPPQRAAVCHLCPPFSTTRTPSG